MTHAAFLTSSGNTSDDADRARYRRVTTLLGLLLLASMTLSLSLGSFPTSIDQVVHALAVAGAILQGIVRNPLASPDVIGITSGAAMAAVLFLALFTASLSIHWLPAAALLGALLSALLILLLAWRHGITPSRLVLVGIGLSAAMGAVTTLLIVTSDDAAAMTAYVWLTGSLYAAQWQDVLGMLPWLLVAVPLCLSQARQMNAMALGDQVAQGLGVNILQSRLLLMACSVALAGAAVAFAGGLSFVGLIAPHIAARLVGRSFTRLVPIAALVGSLIVLYADLLGRVAFLPKDLPAGIFVSGVGAPFFVYLLHRTRADTRG